MKAFGCVCFVLYVSCGKGSDVDGGRRAYKAIQKTPSFSRRLQKKIQTPKTFTESCEVKKTEYSDGPHHPDYIWMFAKETKQPDTFTFPTDTAVRPYAEPHPVLPLQLLHGKKNSLAYKKLQVGIPTSFRRSMEKRTLRPFTQFRWSKWSRTLDTSKAYLAVVETKTLGYPDKVCFQKVELSMLKTWKESSPFFRVKALLQYSDAVNFVTEGRTLTIPLQSAFLEVTCQNPIKECYWRGVIKIRGQPNEEDLLIPYGTFLDLSNRERHEVREFDEKENGEREEAAAMAEQDETGEMYTSDMIEEGLQSPPLSRVAATSTYTSPFRPSHRQRKNRYLILFKQEEESEFSIFTGTASECPQCAGLLYEDLKGNARRSSSGIRQRVGFTINKKEYDVQFKSKIKSKITKSRKSN